LKSKLFRNSVAARACAATSNLSVSGAATTVDRTVNGQLLPSVLSQIPNIPSLERMLDRIGRVIAAVKARVPRARIIMIGVREFAGWSPPLDPEELTALKIGATFVDRGQS
jgi:hypothetical protein